MKFAPIAIFTYNRSDYLKILINSLRSNALSKLSVVFIFSDGWKCDSDKEEVLNVRKYIAKISGFKKVFIILRPNNFGLSKNIIEGINFVLKKYKKIIVLEDDLKLSKYFLNFINEGLNIYEHEKKVASINGWFFPVDHSNNTPDNFFIRAADCWGWGTWKRAWDKFEPNGEKLLYAIKKKKLEKLFNFNNSFYYTRMLQNQVDKKNDSWAIRWYASTFLKKMYTLYPKISLVRNVGTKNGINSRFDFLNLGQKFKKKSYSPVYFKKIEEDNIVRKQIEFFFKKNLIYRIKEYLKNIFND
jgi:glycosyltransferase involved in cell wall biosynthesis